MSIVISLATSPMSFLRNELTTRPSRNAAIISSSCRTFVLRITCWMKCLSWANISQETTKRPHHPKTHGCLNITGLLALFSRRTWRNLDSPGSFATLDNNLPHQTNDWSYMRMVEWCGVRGGKWKCKVEVCWFPTNVTSTKLTNYLSFRYGASAEHGAYFSDALRNTCQPWGLQ